MKKKILIISVVILILSSIILFMKNKKRVDISSNVVNRNYQVYNKNYNGFLSTNSIYSIDDNYKEFGFEMIDCGISPLCVLTNKPYIDIDELDSVTISFTENGIIDTVSMFIVLKEIDYNIDYIFNTFNQILPNFYNHKFSIDYLKKRNSKLFEISSFDYSKGPLIDYFEVGDYTIQIIFGKNEKYNFAKLFLAPTSYNLFG